MQRNSRPARNVLRRAQSWKCLGLSLLIALVLAACTTTEPDVQDDDPTPGFSVVLGDFPTELTQGNDYPLTGNITATDGFEGDVSVELEDDGSEGIELDAAPVSIAGTAAVAFSGTLSVAAEAATGDRTMAVTFSSAGLDSESLALTVTVVAADDADDGEPGEDENRDDEPDDGEPGDDEPDDGEPGDGEPGDDEPVAEPMPYSDFAGAVENILAEITTLDESLSASPPDVWLLLLQVFRNGAPFPFVGAPEGDGSLLPRGLWRNEWDLDDDSGYWWMDWTREGDLPGSGELQLDYQLAMLDDGEVIGEFEDTEVLIDWEHDETPTTTLDMGGFSTELPAHMTGRLVHEESAVIDVEAELTPELITVECEWDPGDIEILPMLTVSSALLNATFGDGADLILNIVDAGMELAGGDLNSSGEVAATVFGRGYSLAWDALITGAADTADLMSLVTCLDPLELPELAINLQTSIDLNGQTLDVTVDIATTGDSTLEAGMTVVFNGTDSFEVAGDIDLTDEYPLAAFYVHFDDTSFTIDDFLAELAELFPQPGE